MIKSQMELSLKVSGDELRNLEIYVLILISFTALRSSPYLWMEREAHWSISAKSSAHESLQSAFLRLDPVSRGIQVLFLAHQPQYTLIINYIYVKEQIKHVFLELQNLYVTEFSAKHLL